MDLLLIWVGIASLVAMAFVYGIVSVLAGLLLAAAGGSLE